MTLSPTTVGVSTGSASSGSFPEDCHVWQQNCPEGMKCTAYGASYELTHCTPLAPDPDGPLDPCEVTGRNEAAFDSCDEWSVCWFLGGSETGTGICLPLCSDAGARPNCPEDWLCTYTTQESELFKCLPPCDPTKPSCPGASSCNPDDFGFHCNDSFDSPKYGDPCQGPCADGLSCALASDVPGCARSLCCTAYCDLNATGPCPAQEQMCVSFYELVGKPAIPKYAHVGLCVVP